MSPNKYGLLGILMVVVELAIVGIFWPQSSVPWGDIVPWEQKMLGILVPTVVGLYCLYRWDEGGESYG
jgi:hypothetical protein